MAMNTVINTNMMALTAHRNLASVGNRQNKASQRLSSGKKINSAADDAAGLAISEKMKAQIKGLDMAAKNSEDAISLIQTAEGSLTEVNDMLTRVRELTVQAANDTNQKEDREKIGEEVAALLTEIDSISERTEFNEKKLNDGSFKDGFFQIGSNAGQKLDVSIGNMDVKSLGLNQLKDAFGIEQNGDGKSISNVKVTKQADGQNYTSTENAATANKSEITLSSNTKVAAKDDTVTVKITYTDASGNTKEKEFTGLKDTANTPSEKTLAGVIGDAIKNDTELSSLFKVTTNPTTNSKIEFETIEAGAGKASISGLEVKIDKTGTTTIESGKVTQVGKDAYVSTDLQNIQNGDTITIGDKTYTKVAAIGKDTPENSFADAAGLQKLLEKDGYGVRGTAAKVEFFQKGDGYQVGDVSDEGKVYSDAISNIDKALKTVTTQRSKLGANQNRLEHTINNLNLSSENLSAAKSRIEDTDMAKEMMNLTSANVLQQAATSMLAQANQAPNKITQLLG